MKPNHLFTSQVRVLISFAFLFFIFAKQHLVVLAQGKMPVNIQVKLNVDTSRVRVYKQPIKSTAADEIKTLVLKMNYGSADILNAAEASVLGEVGCNIISVELVYTMFDKKDIQMRLNQKRIMELYFLAPDVFAQNLVRWKYVEQLGYKTESEARGLFHGFVITYHQVEVYKPLTLEGMKSDIKAGEIADTTCYRALRGNIDFSDQLVCIDMTGSMSPYYLQVLTWLHLRDSDKALPFAFFNDGDAKWDEMKRIGEVGGIYLCNSNDIDTVITTAYRCIFGGCGGDCPENNMEAAIKGLKKYPSCKQVVMVADNWAPMRDYALIDQVKVPVHVIVCGTSYAGITTSINPHYLDLARRTGGYVSTMEEQITDLSKYKEGEEFTISGSKYVVRRGVVTAK